MTQILTRPPKGIILKGVEVRTGKGEVIQLNEDWECVLKGSLWFDLTICASLFPIGTSPKINDDIDWRSLPDDVLIKAQGGSYATVLYNCIIEIL